MAVISMEPLEVSPPFFSMHTLSLLPTKCLALGLEIGKAAKPWVISCCWSETSESIKMQLGCTSVDLKWAAAVPLIAFELFKCRSSWSSMCLLQRQMEMVKLITLSCIILTAVVKMEPHHSSPCPSQWHSDRQLWGPYWAKHSSSVWEPLDRLVRKCVD